MLESVTSFKKRGKLIGMVHPTLSLMYLWELRVEALLNQSSNNIVNRLMR